MSEHQKVHDLLGPYVMGALGPEEKREIEDHFRECPRCGQEAHDLRLVHERLADLASATPPQELKDRVLTGMPRRRTRWAPLVAAAAFCVLAVLGALYLSGIFEQDEVAHATLEPTNLAPGAGGELRVEVSDANARARLEVWDLPRPDSDEYYELWFGKGSGRMSAGTFTVDKDGRTTLSMSVPGEASHYEQVGITLEKFPREPRISSAKVVLGGELRQS